MFKSTKTAWLILVGLFFLGYYLFSHSITTNIEQDPAQTENIQPLKIPQAFQEAFGIFKKKALFYDQNIPVNFNDPKSFNAYLKKMDSASEYLEPFEYTVFVTSQRDYFIGIGMEIEKNDAGKVVCFPASNSPAYSGGVESGDILETIENQNVAGLSIYKVASLIKGKEGSNVKITIVKKNGDRKELVLDKKYLATSSVSVKSEIDFDIIRIYSFNSGTKRDLENALNKVKKSSVIIFDLRNNPGGDLYKAIDSAMLFLENNMKIVTIKGIDTAKSYVSTTPAFNSTTLIYIWQNQNTASAAEVFTAALIANKRAESIGKVSYGKGTTQDIVELNDGAAIIFTSGFLLTPDDVAFHRQGVEPTYVLEGQNLTDQTYLEKTRSLIKNHQSR